VPKWLKLIFALLLLPVCWGAAIALWRVVSATGKADTAWVAFGSGAACWLVIYLLLPKPMLIYVFGHELTHVLWAWAMGGRVKKFKASATGGQVVVTKTNFLIALAPYFFPVYAVLVVLVFLVLDHFWQWRWQIAWFHLLLGVAYMFHLTLTANALKSQQSDITDQGYLFSAVVIYLGNIIVLLIGIPLVTGQGEVIQAFKLWHEATRECLLGIAKLANR
jgi:hypothetical protein